MLRVTAAELGRTIRFKTQKERPITTTTTCFAHHHMTPAEYGFWHFCRDLSPNEGILYFDGRNMVKLFAPFADGRLEVITSTRLVLGKTGMNC